MRNKMKRQLYILFFLPFVIFAQEQQQEPQQYV